MAGGVTRWRLSVASADHNRQKRRMSLGFQRVSWCHLALRAIGLDEARFARGRQQLLGNLGLIVRSRANRGIHRLLWLGSVDHRQKSALGDLGGNKGAALFLVNQHRALLLATDVEAMVSVVVPSHAVGHGHLDA